MRTYTNNCNWNAFFILLDVPTFKYFSLNVPIQINLIDE